MINNIYLYIIIANFLFLLICLKLYFKYVYTKKNNNLNKIKNYSSNDSKLNLKIYNPPVHGQITKFRAFKWGEKYEDWEANNYCFIDEDPYQIYFNKEKRFWYHWVVLCFSYYYNFNLYFKKNSYKKTEIDQNLDIIEWSLKYYYKIKIEHYAVHINRMFLFKSGMFAQNIDQNVEFSHMKSFFRVCWAFPTYCYVRLSEYFKEYYDLSCLFYWNIVVSMFYNLFINKSITFIFDFFSFYIIYMFCYEIFLIIFIFFILYVYLIYSYINKYNSINKFFNISFKNNAKILFLKQTSLKYFKSFNKIFKKKK